MPSLHSLRQSSIISFFGGIAQLGERLHGMQEVSGSIPLTSTTRRSQEVQKMCLTQRKRWVFSCPTVPERLYFPRDNDGNGLFLSVQPNGALPRTLPTQLRLLPAFDS